MLAKNDKLETLSRQSLSMVCMYNSMNVIDRKNKPTNTMLI